MSASETLTVARNVSTRYVAVAVEMALGLVMLPFNVSHLGAAAYGLWMLTASITAYLSILDLGYSGAIVKYVAHYRAKRDIGALNETLSTAFLVFTAFGVLSYCAAGVLAIFFHSLFHLPPDQAAVGRIVLLVVALNVSAGIVCTVYGGVINGFQRYDLNNIVGAGSSVATAIVNVLTLQAGYGLVGLVVATTAVRLLTYAIYRSNAYRVFPEMRLRVRSFSRARFRELTQFGVYMAVIDWANRLNYSLDAIVIGVFMGTSAVAVWSVAQRLAEATQRLTNQLSDILFPTVVHNDVSKRIHRLQTILLVGTRLSLATVVPIAGALALTAGPLVQAWVGPDFAGSVLVLRLLAIAVIARVGQGTASMLLKATGRHQLVARINITTALVNVALSIALVRTMGLPGVALGTLVPVSVAAVFAIFPIACRRVQLPVRRAAIEAVWPALWPSAVMGAYVVVTRPLIGDSLVAVGVQTIAAAGVYAVTFLFFGVTARERRLYISKAIELSSGWRLMPGVSEGA